MEQALINEVKKYSNITVTEVENCKRIFEEIYVLAKDLKKEQ